MKAFKMCFVMVSLSFTCAQASAQQSSQTPLNPSVKAARESAWTKFKQAHDMNEGESFDAESCDLKLTTYTGRWVSIKMGKKHMEVPTNHKVNLKRVKDSTYSAKDGRFTLSLQCYGGKSCAEVFHHIKPDSGPQRSQRSNLYYSRMGYKKISNAQLLNSLLNDMVKLCRNDSKLPPGDKA